MGERLEPPQAPFDRLREHLAVGYGWEMMSVSSAWRMACENVPTTTAIGAFVRLRLAIRYQLWADTCTES